MVFSSDELRSFTITLAAMLACCLECPAHAQPARVDAAQLCAVKDAIRWREAAWTPAECRRVADALNETRDPPRMLAVCINESDLRDRVVSVVRPGIYDVGLCGVRCVTRTPEEDTRDLCLNGPARGHALRQLRDPVANVRLADEILHGTHGGNLRRYNGGTREHGYSARVAAVLAALGGVDVFAKRRLRGQPRRESRMERLARLVVDAVGKGGRS